VLRAIFTNIGSIFQDRNLRNYSRELRAAATAIPSDHPIILKSNCAIETGAAYGAVCGKLHLGFGRLLIDYA